MPMPTLGRIRYFTQILLDFTEVRGICDCLFQVRMSGTMQSPPGRMVTTELLLRIPEQCSVSNYLPYQHWVSIRRRVLVPNARRMVRAKPLLRQLLMARSALQAQVLPGAGY